VGCTNKPGVCPNLVLYEGEYVPLVFQEEFMTSTMKISAAVPELLADISNVDVEEVVEIESADEEEPN